MRKSFTISDLPPQERPRERLINLGPQALSISELIAIILERGISGESILSTSQKIISRFGSLQNLQNATLEDLQTIKGLGLAKACQLKACFEIAHRLETPLVSKTAQYPITSNSLYQLLRPKISRFKKEHFIVISIDIKQKIIGLDTISIGHLTSSVVHPRETLSTVIGHHASSFIIAHNHPSGDPEPSEKDIEITKIIFEAGQNLSITMLDHLIICPTSFFSFSQNQVLHPKKITK